MQMVRGDRLMWLSCMRMHVWHLLGPGLTQRIWLHRSARHLWPITYTTYANRWASGPARCQITHVRLLLI